MEFWQMASEKESDVASRGISTSNTVPRERRSSSAGRKFVVGDVWKLSSPRENTDLGLLNLFKQLKNSNGAIEKCANEFG